MSKLPSLFSIQSELLILSAEMDEHFRNGTELPVELEDEMSRALFQESEKIAACCSFFDACDSELELAELQVKKLREYKSSIEKKRSAILNVAKKAMIARGVKSLDGDMGRKITLRRSTRLACEATTDDLPFEYLRCKYEIDIAEIKKALQDGKEVVGCSLKENESVNWK
jgi:hypothetical protein